MSTISQTLTASCTLKRYFAPNRHQDGSFVGELSSDWSDEDSSGHVFISEDLESYPYRFAGDNHSAPALVRVWGDPVSASDMFPLNAPEGLLAAQQAFRLWSQTENADASRVFPSVVFPSVIDQLNALLLPYAEHRSVPEPAVEDVPPSPSLPPVVEAELAEFSAGVDGMRPTEQAVCIARVLSDAAVRHIKHPEITVDIDGELSFDLRLDDGRLVFAELGLDGKLDMGVYGSDNQMLEHDAKATCQYLLSIIES